MHQALHGRVFDRQQRFANLPIELQRATKQFEDHAKLNKSSLFQDHHHALVKTVYSVKGKELIDAVIQWIETRGAAPTSHHGFGHTSHHGAASTSHHGTAFTSDRDTAFTSDRDTAFTSDRGTAPTADYAHGSTTHHGTDSTSHQALPFASNYAEHPTSNDGIDATSHNESPSIIESVMGWIHPSDTSKTSHDAAATPSNTTGAPTARDKLGAATANAADRISVIGHSAADRISGRTSTSAAHTAADPTLHRTDDTTLHSTPVPALHHTRGETMYDEDSITSDRTTDPTMHNAPTSGTHRAGGFMSHVAPHHTSDSKSHHAASTANYAPIPASHKLPSTTTSSFQVYEHARQIAEALVLSGFLTPYHDDEKHMDANEPDRFVNDNELLVPVAPGFAESTTTSVWSVAPIATYTAFLKRKAGLLGSGKDVYVVISESTQRAYLFKSDVAHVPIGEIPGNSVSVQTDNSHYHHGVRVELLTEGAHAYAIDLSHLTKKLAKDKPELFDLGSSNAQKAFVHAWQRIGAEYRKASTTGVNAGVAMPASSTRASHAPIGAA